MIGARTPAPAFELVPFQGVEILAARQDETIYVPMKRFCGSLGLPWDGARRRIERDEVLREGAVIMTVPSSGGAQQQQTLPLDLIPLFLVGAESSRYAPELQERIRVFRRTCATVLFRHFFGQQEAAPVPVLPEPAPPTDGAQHAAIRNAVDLVEHLRREPPGPVRTFYQDMLAQTCAGIGLEAPLVPILPIEGRSPTELIDALLVGLQTLDARRARYNHLGDAAHGRIALNLPQLARLFAKHDIDVRIDDELRDVLRAGDRRYRTTIRSIESAIRAGRAVQCHVLERASW